MGVSGINNDCLLYDVLFPFFLGGGWDASLKPSKAVKQHGSCADACAAGVRAGGRAVVCVCVSVGMCVVVCVYVCVCCDFGGFCGVYPMLALMKPVSRARSMPAQSSSIYAMQHAQYANLRRDMGQR